MKKSLLFALFSLTAAAFTPVAAEDQAAPSPAEIQKMKQDFCTYTICQKNVHVTLKAKDGSTFDRTYDVLPGIVQEIGTSVLAGQTIYIEADVSGGILTNLKAVDKITHPEKTIIANLEQVDGKGMSLKVTNPFDKAIKFSLGVMPLDNGQLLKASSCPILAKASSNETWSYPIFQVLLADGHTLEPSDKADCTQ